MPSNTILVVDDDALILETIKDALEDAQFDVVTAANGRQALDILMADQEKFDVIVADRLMPQMDGMALLAAVRENFSTSNIPVILQTAEAREEQMREGVKAGAYYYITKPYDDETLVAVVRSALESRRQYQAIMDYMHVSLEAARPLEKGRFRFKTLREASSVAWMISQHAEEQAAVAICLSELIINSIEHGNLNIGGPEKERLIRQNCWREEVARRLELPENASKVVVVEFDATGDDVLVSIEDQGAGFDPTRYLGQGLDQGNRVQGRGILKAQTMAFKSINFDKGGSRVVATFVRDKD